MSKFIGILWFVVALVFILAGDNWPAALSVVGSMIWFAVAGIERHVPKSQS